MITKSAKSRYSKHLKEQYADYWPPKSKLQRDMLATFRVRWNEGPKYLRLTVFAAPNKPTVHSFIVREGDLAFKPGSILKAKSKTAPTRNFARGNILNSRSYKTINWNII